MRQEIFQAGVQYNDMKGSAAADRHDEHTLSTYLNDNNLISADEMLIAIELYSGETHNRTQDSPVSVTAIVATGEGYDSISAAVESGAPLKVRKIDLEMPLNEFFGFFKRFSVTISKNSLLEGQKITFDE